ncbi:proteoglycan 4 [Cyclopterus lumpus]|uniref:proteoglycan 4 n=1 Tax=Cyclopterus lumpus TaxID=8103 RepID=UPI001486AF80|nr:proteoglycan 4 [Cyclopterus lumpus]
MSADDFQTKYSSVMESMLKSAIAETTKLFETMVDELKVEISGMKKENEDLKLRCSQFESARNPPTVHTGGSDSRQGRTNDSEKRDRAVQCDLVPIRTILVEQCQPLRHSSLQNQEQQGSCEQMEHSLQDHTYVEGTTQMAFILVKQEDSYDDSSQQSVVKQEEAEALVCGLVLSDKAGSPQAPACATEYEGIQGMESSLQGAQNQLSELEHSQVLSLAAINDNIEEESEFSQKGEHLTSEKKPLVVAQRQSEVEPLKKEQPLVKPQQCQKEGKVSVSEQANVSQQHYVDLKSTKLQLSHPTPPKKGETCEALKSSVAQSEASPKPEKRRRGRPPKKTKRLQHSGKEIGSLAVSEASLSKICSSEMEKASESQPSMVIEEGAIRAPFPASPANETINTPTVQPRERRTSVTLQDALLLVEAMNQSIIKGILTSPQRMATSTQTQCAPCVGTLETVDEIPAEPAQLTTEKLSVTSVTSDATPTNIAQAHIKIVIPKQHHTVKPSNTMTSLTDAVKTSVQSMQQHLSRPLITLVAPSKPGMAVSHKLIAMPRSESSLTRHKIAALSPTQLPTVVSTVVAAQKNRLPGITTAGMPLGSNSLSSVPQKTTRITSGKSIPVVPSQSTTSSDLQSGTLPHPKITIIIPRQASSKPPSKTIVLTTKQGSTESAAAIVSLPQLITSQELSISVDTQTVLDEVAAISSQKRYKTLSNLDFPKQTASELVNASIETCSSSNMSVGLVPSSVSPMVRPTAVVRLTRLPFPVSPKEAVFVSRLPTIGSPKSRSILKEDATQEKPSSVVISTPVSETLILEESSPDSGPSTPSQLSAPVVENSTIAINKTEPPAGNGTAGEPTSNSDEEIISIAVQDCPSPHDPPMEEKESAGLIQLIPITTKDASDPHLQMTKAQFLAQLAVTPVPQDPTKVSSENSVDATTAETSTSEKKRLQKESLVAQLRSHLKTRLQARRTKTNSESCTVAETLTVNPKKSRPQNESPEKREPIPISPKDPGVVEDVTFPMKTTKSPTPVSPRRSGLRGADVSPKKTVNEPSFIISRRFKATRKSAPVTPKRSSSGAHGVASKTKKSTSVSRRGSTAMEERARPKKIKSTSVSPSRSNSIIESVSPKKTKSTSVSPRRSSSIKESTTPKKTKSTSVSPRRSTSKNTRNISVRPRWISSTRDGASPKRTKATSLSPQRTSLSTDGVIPKKAKSIVGQETSNLSKKGTSPKVSIDKSMFCRRRCTLPKDGSSSKQNKRESNFLSPRYSITADSACTNNSKIETGSPNVRWPELAKDGLSPRKTNESTPAKKPRLIQDGTGPKQKLIVGDAKRLAKAAKAKTIAKMKNGAKTGQLAESRASCEAVRKCTAKAVWTPPRLPARKTPPTGRQKELLSPLLPDHTLVFPPSVSLLPIPVKAPPVVSPLQPLSVIGRRLLKNQCGECGRVLSSLAALESHVSLHAGRRPFSCTLCGKRFPDSKGLKRHGRVHRNGRIHICQQCGKGFVYRFGLTKHLQMVHRKLKPFICQICHGAYFTKRDMEAHIRMHTGEKPFHCNLCEKKFARRVELNVHLRWHNGEKRHWCPFCGKGFLDFNNLKRHKYIHTGEKPHSCAHCPKSFTQSGHLKKHVKNVHKVL